MSKSIQPVSITILGTEYKIACAPDERESLISSAKALDLQMRKIRDTGKVNSTDRIAVLAALNMTQDSHIKTAPVSIDICERISKLREKIENVLENP